MGRIHDGWTREELAAVERDFGQAPKQPEPEKDPSLGKEQFLSEVNADTTAAPPVVPTALTPEESAAQAAQKTVSLKTDAMAKKFNAKLNKMKRSFAEALPKAVGVAVREKGPEYALTDEDTEILAESVENCLEILDIDFQVQPFTTTLTNPLWVLILPLLALILVFAPKTYAAQKRARENEQRQPNEPAPVAAD